MKVTNIYSRRIDYLLCWFNLSDRKVSHKIKGLLTKTLKISIGLRSNEI